MRKSINAVIAMVLVACSLGITGCGAKDSGQTDASKDVASSATESALDSSKKALIETLDSLVSSSDFTKKTDSEQQEVVQDTLNQYVSSSVISAGTISFDNSTRTFNFTYTDGQSGFYSLSGVKYAVNNEDNLVWQGQQPVVNDPNKSDDSAQDSQISTDSTNTDTSSIDQYNNNNGTVQNDNSYTNNSEKPYIIGVKLDYNNATGLIQGRFITSTGGAYAFDFTGKYTMADLDLLEQLNNIIETRTCTYGIDSATLSTLKSLSEQIDCSADLYQTVGDTQQDITSEVIYTYNKKKDLLVECCSTGVKESKLNDENADTFVADLVAAIDNKVQRIKK